MMTKTVPLRQATWRRLSHYRGGRATFDEVISELMNAVPAEVVSARVLRQHDQRMRTRSGRPWREALGGR